MRYTPVEQPVQVSPDKLPGTVLSMIKDVKVSYQELQYLPLKSLAVMIPCRVHPQTKPKTMSGFFSLIKKNRILNQ